MKRRKDVLEQMIWELRRAFRELAAAADANLHPLGIQASERAFLEFLAREAVPVSLSHLARKHSVSRQHIQQMLRRLNHPEWIEEIADENDKRTILLRLSPAGQSIWKKIRAADHEALERLARQLSSKEIQLATGTIRRLRQELKNMKEEYSHERA